MYFLCFLFILITKKIIFFIPLVGQEPDIPDLIDYMQSGDETRIINAAGYLQHLCYSKENVKDKVRYLGGLFVHYYILPMLGKAEEKKEGTSVKNKGTKELVGSNSLDICRSSHLSSLQA